MNIQEQREWSQPAGWFDEKKIERSRPRGGGLAEGRREGKGGRWESGEEEERESERDERDACPVQRWRKYPDFNAINLPWNFTF